MSEFATVRDSAQILQGVFGTPPKVVTVLGSGLGGLVQGLARPTELAYPNIGWPRPAVQGHAGMLTVGFLGKARVGMACGRSHLYEGWTPQEVVRMVRTLRLWGVETLILTAAAGGVYMGAKPGDVMVVTNHLNRTGQSPFRGQHDPRLCRDRFPDMTRPYDPELTEILRVACLQCEVTSHTGVYVGNVGPEYETAAEVQTMLNSGYKTVGMSMVHEAMAFRAMPHKGDPARALGKVVGLAMIANAAAGLQSGDLNHTEVLAACQRVGPKLVDVLRLAIPQMM